MKVRVGCQFQFESEAPVPLVMLVQAHEDHEHELGHQSRWLSPSEVPLHTFRDSSGNTCWRLFTPGGALNIRYDAVIEVSPEPDIQAPEALLVPVQHLPDETLPFTLPSRCIESDLLMDAAWQLFGSTPQTWARVQAIVDWVHQNVRYQGGSSNPTITARDVYERRIGVCRDFALLSVAFCRAMNIPARYTFGYLPDIAVEPDDTPMDFHAWFEAYLGDRWYTFDARHNRPRIGRVVVGRGRDAVDVAMSTAYGSLQLREMIVWADEVSPEYALQEPDADSLEAAEIQGRLASNQPTGTDAS